MADVSISLSGLIVPRLGQEVSKPDGIRSWISKGGYYVDSLSNTGTLVLRAVDPSTIVSFIGFDYERFALSSWESFCLSRIDSSQYSLTEWPLLKIYYSGFFAAHAIMRALGSGIVKLERSHVDTINLYAAGSTNASYKLKSGMFAYALSQGSDQSLLVSLQPHAEGSGVHDGFWKAFARFLDEIAASAINKRLPEADLLLSGVNEITPFLRSAAYGKSVWFSSIRNEINYQHKHGVWHPLQNSRKLNNLIGGLSHCDSCSVRLDRSQENDPIGTFIAIGQYLALLNFELSESIAARSTSARAFSANWKRLKAVFPN